MMNLRQVVGLTCLALVLASAAWAEEAEEVWWGSNYMPGNIRMSIEGAYESVAASGSGVAAYPEVEFVVFKPSFGEVTPIDIGASVRARIGFALGGGVQSPLALGAGAFINVHFGFKGLGVMGLGFLNRIEMYSEVGLALDFLRHDEVDSLFGVAGNYGLAYHITDSIGVRAGYTDWLSSEGVSIGAQIKLGPGQEVVPLEIEGQGIDDSK